MTEIIAGGGEKIELGQDQDGSYLELFLQFIDHFGGRDVFEGKTTRAVVNEFLSSGNKSFLNSYSGEHKLRGKANTYICHCWDDLFLSLVDDLIAYQKQQSVTEPLCFWIDIFSLNQSDTTSQISDKEWISNYLPAKVKSMNKFIVHLANWKVLRRSWCIWEMYLAIIAKIPLEICISLHDQDRIFQALRLRPLEELKALDYYFIPSQSQATKPEEQEQLLLLLNTTQDLRRKVAYHFLKAISELISRQISVARESSEPQSKLILKYQEILFFISQYQEKYLSTNIKMNEFTNQYKRIIEDYNLLFGENGIEGFLFFQSVVRFYLHHYSNSSSFLKQETWNGYLKFKKLLLSGESEAQQLEYQKLMIDLLYLYGQLLFVDRSSVDESLPIFEKCYALACAKDSGFGELHSFTLNILNSIFLNHILMQNYDQAVRLGEELLIKYRTYYSKSIVQTSQNAEDQVSPVSQNPENIQEILDLYSNLGPAYNCLNQYEKAEECYLHCYERRAAILGLCHDEVLSVLRNRAINFHMSGNNEKAEEMYLLMLENYQITQKNQNLLLWETVLKSLHENLIHDRCYDEGERILKFYLKYIQEGQENHQLRSINPSITDEEVQTSNMKKIFRTKGLLIRLYKTEGKYDEAEPLAIDLHQQCMNYFQTDKTAFEKNFLHSLSLLGTLYGLQNKHQLAIPIFENYFTIIQECPSPLNQSQNLFQSTVDTDTIPICAETLNNLGFCYIQTQQYEKALECYKRAYNLRITHFGENHEFTKKSKKALNELEEFLRKQSSKCILC